MEIKLKTIDKLLIGYIIIIFLLTLVSCKTKHVTKTHTDSLVKEVYQVKDSIHTQTIFEYETIYDTIRKEYTTHIKKIIATESQNKTLQGTKEVKVSKDTKEVAKEPTKANFKLYFILGLICFIIGFFVKK